MKNLVLVGNPNVGKTTFYNKLTNSNEHTGNWNGKTVGISENEFLYKNQKYIVRDLPGISTLENSTLEENIAIEYLSNTSDKAIVFIDGTNLIRGLFLYFEVKRFVEDITVVITMKDLLDKDNVEIDIELLKKYLACNIIYISLNGKNAIYTILEKINAEKTKKVNYNDVSSLGYEDRTEQIYKKCVDIVNIATNKVYERPKIEQKIDTLFLGKKTGIPLTIFILFIFLWLSIVFCNLFQGILYGAFSHLLENLNLFLIYIGCTNGFIDTILNGGVATSLFVASVMIPPMLIFFPVFTIMEETGVIPRIAFNVDGFLSKFHLSGKNSISLMLGFGCNCVGITSTRIFENEKTRRTAILINNFVPCNGRLPMLFLLVFTFIAKNIYTSFFIIGFVITLNILMALFVGFIMNRLYDNKESDFVYELPVYKKPDFRKVLKVSLLEKATSVILKSLIFSFVAGVIVFILRNVSVDGVSVINSLVVLLEPLGKLMGLSGVILVAFIFGLSANEIVLPIVFMLYTNGSLFSNNSTLTSLSLYGFNTITAICMIVFSLNHYPCFSALMTIKKETNSTTFTVLCAIVPLIIGFILCICVNFILQILQSLLF